MDRLTLYVRYALRSFIRGRSRSLFGAFCVAVGVASVVALGLVAGNFQDAVTGNAKQLNRGDVSMAAPGSRMSLHDYAYFQTLKNEGKITAYTPELTVDTLIETPGGNQANVVVGGATSVQGQRFPFYDTITAIQPSGVPLKNLLRGPHDAVVSQTVFDKLNLHIGGPLRTVYRFGGSNLYTVRGIVPDNAPDPGFGGGLFPYWAMVNRSSMTSYIKANDNAASQIYMTTRTAAQADEVKRLLKQHFGPAVSPKTIADVQKDSVNGADGLRKFFRIMSLIAVVIGGIGIINTMLVAARRRRGEIAILKSIGMKGRQVIVVFAIESLVLAIAGTAVGVLLGMGASAIVNNVTQSLAGYPIPWSLHADAVVAGILVGVVGTVLFSYLPVVRASRVRPIMALRSDTLTLSHHSLRAGVRTFFRHPFSSFFGGIKRLPRRSGLRTALLVLLLAALMGYFGVLYTGLFSGGDTVVRGVIAGIGTLVIAGVLTQIFVMLVWLVSRLPTFGLLSTRMAFRSMRTQRRRLGSTLLAMCIGILAVASIAILAQNLKSALSQGLEKHQNFNVYVQTKHNPALVARVQRFIHTLPGIQHQDVGALANLAVLSTVDGVPINQIATGDISQALNSARAVVGQDVRIAQNDYIMTSGRNLNASDSGTDHVVVSEDFTKTFHIKLGSHLVYTDGKLNVPFTVVGIASQNNFLVAAETVTDLRYMQKVGLAAPAPSHEALIFLQINHANLSSDVARLRVAVPDAAVLDLSSFLQFTQIVDKLALFPEIIGGLALFAGVIIIANTVALAMLERRREFGIMKAVGAKRGTILRFLLVENAIVGFLGAGAGVLLAMLIVAIVSQNLIGIAPSFDWGTPILLVLVGIALAIGASALTAYPASGEKPMTVLRYE